jgi:antitoxin VapB
VTSSSRNHDDGVTGQEVVFQEDAVLQCLVPAFYLSLGLRVERGAAHMVHPAISRPLHWDEPRPIAMTSGQSARQLVAAAPLREIEWRTIFPLTDHQVMIDYSLYQGVSVMGQTAKLFQNGKSQAVRLPLSYRFEGSEVSIRRDEQTGDVILSRKPESLAEFFAFARKLKADIPGDFLGDDERRTAPQDRDPFEGWPVDGTDEA